MRVLALETSGDACSCALLVDDALRAAHVVAPREHTRRLLPMIDRLLAEAALKASDLDVIAFGRGPGSFTGVRIAVSAAQGLALAAGAPVLGVSSLEALAAGAVRELGARRVVACVDARMSEVYLGAYAARPDGSLEPVTPEQVTPASSVALPHGQGWLGVGSGFEAYGELLAGRLGNALEGVHPHRLADASDVARIAQARLSRGEAGADAACARPVYLRNRVAHGAGGGS